MCLQHIGLPHSDISGSKVVCTSPKLFAAYHVLHSLLEPRHPPFALLFLFLLYFSRHPIFRGCGNCRLELFCRVASITAATLVFARYFQFCLLLLIQYVKDHFRRQTDSGEDRTQPVVSIIIVANCSTSNTPISRKLSEPPERRCSSRTFRYGYLVTT